MLFPFVERRSGNAPERLVADHGELVRAIEGVERSLVAHGERAAAKEAVATFASVLVAHLDREEELTVPILLGLTPEEGWALVHGSAD